MTTRTRLLLASTLGALALATPFALRLSSTPPATPTPTAPRVTVAAVESRSLIEAEELTGRVEAIESVDLRAEVSGRITAIHFQAGAHVDAGQLLFSLDSAPYAASVKAAQAALARAEVLHRTLSREADRSERLLVREAISQEDAEGRRARADEAHANLLAAQAALAQAQIALDRTSVRAPIAGRISRALVTVGNLVGPASPLTSVVSTGRVHVYADVPEATALRYQSLLREGRLTRDAEGRIQVALSLGDDRSYQTLGYIESTDNRLNASTGTLLVRMVFDDPNHALTPGLFARVRLPLGTPTETLLISDRAIGTDQSQKFVLTVDSDRRVAYRVVQLGGLIEGKRIIRAGLQPGEHVIVNGLQRVRPGMAVDPETEPAPTSVARL